MRHLRKAASPWDSIVRHLRKAAHIPLGLKDTIATINGEDDHGGSKDG